MSNNANPRSVNPTSQEAKSSFGRSVEGSSAGSSSQAVLKQWLAAEELGQEARAERELLEVLHHLPEVEAAIASERLLRRQGGEDFASRLVRRIEDDSQAESLWTPKKSWIAVAVAVVLCWLGVMVYASMLGVSPSIVSSVGDTASFVARGLARVPAAGLAAVAEVSRGWVEARSAIDWLYSPWLLAFGWLSLLLGWGALIALGRLLPEEWAAHSSLRTRSMGAT